MTTQSVPTPSNAQSAPRPESKWARRFGLSPIDVADRDNNFYAVRLFLAARVIFGHAFVLGGVALDAGNASFGRLYNSLGVNGFFVISGFLVTRSLLSSKTITDYVAARVLRIVPALWTMLFLTVPLVVLLASEASPQTWASAGQYLIENLTIIFVTYQIDGVFAGMANPAVNGSIWSLRWEVFCYAALAGIGIIGMIKKRLLIALMTLALIVTLMILGDDPDVEVLAGRIKLCSLFFFGASMALYADRMLVGVWVGVAATLVAGAIGYATQMYDLVYYAFGYLLLSISYSKARSFRAISKAVELRRLGKPDLSYGIFLYAFPIQQLFYYHRVTSDPIMNILLTLIAASVCAYLSSQFVEKPTAALRGRVVAIVRQNAEAVRLVLRRPRAGTSGSTLD